MFLDLGLLMSLETAKRSIWRRQEINGVGGICHNLAPRVGLIYLLVADVVVHDIHVLLPNDDDHAKM